MISRSISFSLKDADLDTSDIGEIETIAVNRLLPGSSTGMLVDVDKEDERSCPNAFSQ